MAKDSKSKSIKKPKVGITNEAGVSPPDAEIYAKADDVPDAVWSSLFNGQLKVMSRFADAASKSEHLTEDEKDVLKFSIEQLPVAVSRLLEHDGGDCSKHDALQLLSHAFIVGALSGLTPDNQQRLRDRLESNRMNETRASISMRVKKRRNIITEHYPSRNKLSISIQCAKRVRDYCRPYFEAAGVKIYGEEAIKDDIAAILADRKQG